MSVSTLPNRSTFVCCAGPAWVAGAFVVVLTAFLVLAAFDVYGVRTSEVSATAGSRS